MKQIIALIPFLAVFLFLSCNEDDDKITKLEKDVTDLQDALDSSVISKYSDSLDFILALNELEYRRYIDSLQRADSLNFGNGTLPFTYNIVVYDGSTTSVYSDNGGARTSAFDAEVTVSVSQFGETQTVTTTDGLASFDNIGRGIVKVSVTAPGYTTLKFSFETIVDPSTKLYEGIDCSCQDFWNFVKTGNIGHDVAIFATEGTLASTLTGRAFVETDLTNGTREVVPEGTIFTAAIDVENVAFQEEYILARNKAIFRDNIISYGYDPNFTASVDADGDYSFTLAGAANERGLPYHFDYSDFLADQIAFIEDNTDVTTETDQTVFGPEINETIIPNVFSAPAVSFFAGSGATASLTTSGDGSIIDIDVVNAGQDFQGTPRVIIPAPASATGTQAMASATVTGDGRIDLITISDNGSGYAAAPGVTITEGAGATAEITALATNSTNGGVASIELLTSGNGFVSAPNVVFSDGALDSATIAQFLASLADDPTATATLNSNGTVANVNVTNSGSDIGFAPNVYITSGFGAVAQVTSETGGVIDGITIVNNGDFYTDVPVAVEAGGVTGTGATFNITLTGGGEVATIAVTGGGTGYVVGDQFNLIGVGSGATAQAVYQGESIEDFSITNSGVQQLDGLYYTNAPAVVFPEPSFKGAGSARATGTAVMDTDGRLVGITITNVGSGYLPAQLPIAIDIVSGSLATATAVLEPLKITEIDVTAAGNGYTAPPRVEIYDAVGVGTGATATAVLTNGQVTSITLDTEGSNYTNPQIAIVDPGTSFNPDNWDGDADDVVFSNPARAEVEVTDGVITAISIVAVGDNYPATTNVVLEALRGTGFAATATVTNGQVVSVAVDAGGNDYVGGNTPGLSEGFAGIEDDEEFYGKTSITRVRDVYYGTGARRKGL